MEHILITGGAGFIGSHFVRNLLNKHPYYTVHVLDKLTYAGNLANLEDVKAKWGDRYRFFQGDICHAATVAEAMAGCSYVVNFAAESHVDRSIDNPGQFITTDVYGTYILLEQAKKARIKRFVQISTDEVYGDVPQGSSTEESPLAPRSPYSASKAGGELIARSHFITYGLPVIITRGSNNFGPSQYPEKFIPLLITNAIDNQVLPIYGDGKQVRDWIAVLDHCEGIDIVLHEGQIGEVYNIGGGNERYNIEIARLILQLLGKDEALLHHVYDRPGHDRRYSLDTSKLRQLNWAARLSFEEALEQTVKWYQEQENWWRPLKQTRIVPSFLRNDPAMTIHL